jgi:hypothetical protein
VTRESSDSTVIGLAATAHNNFVPVDAIEFGIGVFGVPSAPTPTRSSRSIRGRRNRGIFDQECHRDRAIQYYQQAIKVGDNTRNAQAAALDGTKKPFGDVMQVG